MFPESQICGATFRGDVMKCDLCKHQNPDGNTLCGDCAGMITRLIAIEQRMNAKNVGQAALGGTASKAANAASVQL